MFNRFLFPSLIVVLCACNNPAPGGMSGEVQNGQPKIEVSGSDKQKMELSVDGSIVTKDPTPLISSAFMGSRLILSYMSEKDDIQFSVSAHMAELVAGSYQVYNCKAASECDETAPDNNQNATYGPYPKNPLPPASAFRIAYYAPKLGLKPLTLVISSVKDEAQPGNPYKTRRIEGQLTGDLAHVEQEQGGYAWHVAGNTTKIIGSFSVLCSMR
jgi:hypothetical protein